MRGATIAFGGAACLFFQRERLRRQLDAANRCHAVRHVELVDVLRLRRFAVVAEMRVQVDEARHQIHAGAVDRVWPGRRRRRGTRDPRRAGAGDPRNAIALDDDVHGPGRRGAGAIDHHDIADRQGGKRALSFPTPTVGRGDELILLCGDRRVGDQNERDRQGQEHETLRHGGDDINGGWAQRRVAISRPLNFQSADAQTFN